MSGRVTIKKIKNPKSKMPRCCGLHMKRCELPPNIKGITGTAGRCTKCNIMIVNSIESTDKPINNQVSRKFLGWNENRYPSVSFDELNPLRQELMLLRARFKGIWTDDEFGIWYDQCNDALNGKSPHWVLSEGRFEEVNLVATKILENI